MTELERELIRTWIGASPEDAELDVMYVTWDEDAEAVVRAVLRRRLADLINQPASLTVPGDIAINTAANIKALQEQLALLDRIGIEGIDRGLAIARIIPAPDPQPR